MGTHETVTQKEQLENQLASDGFFSIDDTGETTPVQPQDFTALLSDESLDSVSIIDQYWVEKPLVYAVICDVDGETTYFSVEPKLQDEYEQVKHELVYRIQQKRTDNNKHIPVDSGTYKDKLTILNEVIDILTDPNTLPDINSPTNLHGHTTTTSPVFIPDSIVELLNEARHTELTVQAGNFHMRTQDIDFVDKTTVERIVHHVQQDVLNIPDIHPILSDKHVPQIDTPHDSDITITHDTHGSIPLHGGVTPAYS